MAQDRTNLCLKSNLTIRVLLISVAVDRCGLTETHELQLELAHVLGVSERKGVDYDVKCFQNHLLLHLRDEPRAVSLAAELEKGFGIRAEFVELSGDVFQVEYGGKLLFSKRNVGRFPKEGEIQDLITGTAVFRGLGYRRRRDEDSSEQ